MKDIRLIISLKPSEIFSDSGCVPLAAESLRVHSLYRFLGDDLKRNASNLRLYENGNRLANPVTLHQGIRDDAKGFSHWHNTVYFAATDCSDRRTNGRQYKLETSSYTLLGLLLLAPGYFLMAAVIALIFVYVGLKASGLSSLAVRDVETNYNFSLLFIFFIYFYYRSVWFWFL